MFSPTVPAVPEKGPDLPGPCHGSCPSDYCMSTQRWESSCPSSREVLAQLTSYTVCPVVSYDNPVEKTRMLLSPFIVRTLDHGLYWEPRLRPSLGPLTQTFPWSENGYSLSPMGEKASLPFLFYSLKNSRNSVQKGTPALKPRQAHVYKLLPRLPTEFCCTLLSST